MFKITVKDDREQWTEEYNCRGSMEKRYMLVDSHDTAEIVGKAVIKRYNDTIRDDESPREFVSAEYLGPDES